MANKIETPTCVDCGTLHCGRRNAEYPDFCLTTQISPELRDEVMHLYLDDEENKELAIRSAIQEDEFYCQRTRLMETVGLAKSLGAKKVGIATCSGLIRESRVIARVFREHGFEVYSVICKVGSFNKVDLGVPEERTITTGPVACNPIMQAKLLDEAGTDLNVVVGLCVGHDSLFYKHTNTICTTLIAKDKVLCHNPAGAIYTCENYYKKKLAPEAE